MQLKYHVMGAVLSAMLCINLYGGPNQARAATRQASTSVARSSDDSILRSPAINPLDPRQALTLVAPAAGTSRTSGSGRALRSRLPLPSINPFSNVPWSYRMDYFKGDRRYTATLRGSCDRMRWAQGINTVLSIAGYVTSVISGACLWRRVEAMSASPSRDNVPLSLISTFTGLSSIGFGLITAYFAGYRAASCHTIAQRISSPQHLSEITNPNERTRAVYAGSTFLSAARSLRDIEIPPHLTVHDLDYSIHR